MIEINILLTFCTIISICYVITWFQVRHLQIQVKRDRSSLLMLTEVVGRSINTLENNTKIINKLKHGGL